MKVNLEVSRDELYTLQLGLRSRIVEMQKDKEYLLKITEEINSRKGSHDIADTSYQDAIIQANSELLDKISRV